MKDIIIKNNQIYYDIVFEDLNLIHYLGLEEATVEYLNDCTEETKFSCIPIGIVEKKIEEGIWFFIGSL